MNVLRPWCKLPVKKNWPDQYGRYSIAGYSSMSGPHLFVLVSHYEPSSYKSDWRIVACNANGKYDGDNTHYYGSIEEVQRIADEKLAKMGWILMNDDKLMVLL